jgi:hypothetical protein
VGAPSERGDLRASVDAVDASTGGGVPEVDVAVVRATTSSEEVHVPRAPRKSLDGGLVVGLGELGNGQRSGVPDGDEVVVAASSELGTIGAPLKTANLGSVRNKLGNLVLSNANIVVVDKTTSGASGKEVLVPSHDTNTSVMAEHASDLLTLSDIPDLDLTGAETNADVGTVARPLDAADIGIRGGLKKAADTTLIGRPDIDVALQTDSNLVLRAPVEKVKVVVIDKTRGVKDTLRSGSNPTTELSRARGGRLERSVVLLSQVNGLGRLRSGRLELKDASVEAHTTSAGKGILVGNSVGRGSRVVVGLIVVDVEALKSSHGLIGGSGENGRALSAAAFRSLSVREI